MFAEGEDNDLDEEYLDEDEGEGEEGDGDWVEDGLCEEGEGQPLQEQLRAFLDRLDEEHHSEDEGIEDYKLGGYHPVHIGEVLIDRYVIIQKLGWGHFSTVWLARDFKYDNYVAVKIMKSAPHYIEAAYDEVEILQKVAKKINEPEWLRTVGDYEPGKKHFDRDDTHVVHMLNSFLFRGPYGNHFCMVFEILGVNLLEILKRYNYEGVPMDICKEISRQVLIGLDYLHRICKVIHTDLKPENVLVCLSDKEIKEIVDNGQLSKN